MGKGKFNLNLKRGLRNKIYLFLILVLLLYLSFLNLKLIWPFISIFLILVVIEIYGLKRDEEKINQDIDNITEDFGIVTRTTVINSPFPLIITKSDEKILWKSEKYLEKIEVLDIESRIQNIIKEIKEEIILFEETKKSNDEEISINNNTNKTNTKFSQDKYIIDKEIRTQGKVYEIYGEYSIDKSKKQKKSKYDYIISLIFIDKTDYCKLGTLYDDEKLVLGLIEVDNYDEELSLLSPAEKPRIMAEIERQIYNWVNLNKGIVLKTELNQFMCVFEKKILKNLRQDRFKILDDIKNVQSDNRNGLTLSIAINVDGEDLKEIYKNTISLRDILLGRGGDQAVIRENNEHRFYGAKSVEVEKRTRVKARVLSRAMIDKIRGASSVIIMGHKNIDIDALGAAIGMHTFSKQYNDDVYIVSKLDSLGLGLYEDELKKTNIYNEGIINLNEAKDKIAEDSVLIVVDTFRKNYTEFPELIEKIKEIIVIDHHRLTVDNIENVSVKYHEVYASSTSELVTEIIKYSDKTIELTKFEAESLYGGILVDTKNFTFKTGVRTFEAAAYLKSFGVDIIKVKKWFQSNLDFFTIMSDIIKKAEKYKNNIIIAKYEGEDTSIITAKVADELLNISDVKASIIIGQNGKNINLSARSLGDINVQILMEKLGGGGHITVAGAQLENTTVEQTEIKLKRAIDEYIEELNF